MFFIDFFITNLQYLLNNIIYNNNIINLKHFQKRVILLGKKTHVSGNAVYQAGPHPVFDWNAMYEWQTSAVSHKISEEAFSWALSVPLNQSLLIAGDNEEASEEQGLWTYLWRRCHSRNDPDSEAEKEKSPVS